MGHCDCIPHSLEGFKSGAQFFRSACRVTAHCNAWFYCEDAACYDWQTRQSVTMRHCILMRASLKPQPEPRLGDITKGKEFSSYQAGYVKGARPGLPLSDLGCKGHCLTAA